MRALASIALATLASALACPAAHAQWSVDAGVERFNWLEDTAPIAVHEHGPRAFLGVGWMLPKKQGPLVAYHGEVYGGSVSYDGAFQSDPGTPAAGTTGYLGTIQAVQGRWRWPGMADAVVGLEFEAWNRRLSSTQEESFQTVSLRLGAEYVPNDRHPILAGGGVRVMLSTHQGTTVEYAGATYALDLEPEPGSNPFLYGGYRVAPHMTLMGYWDGMQLGSSNVVTMVFPPATTIQVWQPATDTWRLGFRVAYGF